MDLQASVSNKENSPSQVTVPSAACRTKKSPDGKSNTTPQDLGNERRFLGQRDINDPEACSPGLSEDDVLRLEKLSNARPQPRLGDDVVGLVGNRVNEGRNGDFLSNFSEFSQLGRQLREEPLKANSWIEGVQDPGMVGVELKKNSR